MPNAKLLFIIFGMENKTLYYGSGLFETFIYNGITKHFMRHLDRLRKSSYELFEIYIDIEFIKNAFLDKSQKRAYKIMLILKGEEPFYKNPSRYDIKILKRSFKRPIRDISLCISSTKRHSSDKTIYHKTTNYLRNVLAKQEALSKGFFDGIFLSEEGFIQECSSSNILFYKKGEFYTPHLKSGLLNGVVLGLLKEKIKVNEEFIKSKHIREFEGCFILNSLIGAMPVKSIEGNQFKILKDVEQELNLWIEKDNS